MQALPMKHLFFILKRRVAENSGCKSLRDVFYGPGSLPIMVARKKGVVVNMSSKNGLDGEAGYAHYNASKGGVIMLTKTMALELAHWVFG
jgi:NAD(P)-dependent dehydrogenase (short-subunit alcohol dehydrogenase family)